MSSSVVMPKSLFIEEVCRLARGVVISYGPCIEIVTGRGRRLHLSFRTIGTDGINPRVRVAEPPDGLPAPDYKIVALMTRRGTIGGVIAGRAPTVNATITSHPYVDKKTGRTIGRPRFFDLLSMKGIVNLTHLFRK